MSNQNVPAAVFTLHIPTTSPAQSSLPQCIAEVLPLYNKHNGCSGDNHGTNGAHHAHDNTVHARLSFYLDPSQGGQSEFAIGTAGAYRRKFDERQIQIQDARGHESDFSLDTHGFQYCKRASTETDFTDDGQIETVAYPEVQQLLEDV